MMSIKRIGKIFYLIGFNYNENKCKINNMINFVNKYIREDNNVIDLHVHSTMSDGTYTPSQLIKLAKDKGLKAIA